jgi:hypothetical protein
MAVIRLSDGSLFVWSPVALSTALRAAVDALVRIAPSRTDPHAYFQTKSDLVHELRRLALGLDQVVPQAPRAIPLRMPPRNSEKGRSHCESLAAASVDRLKSCRHCRRRRAQQTRRADANTNKPRAA